MMLLLQTIGQAYEDMQTQNQHLQQQVADRDDFNIKVRSIFLLMQTLRCQLSGLYTFEAVALGGLVYISFPAPSGVVGHITLPCRLISHAV
jgi:hypothetical protein